MAVVVEAPIEIVTPPKRYPPVGHCIYCGVYTDKLTKEHIIPHGLAGDSLILPKSSCRGCADKTRDWETACLRHLWWPFRTRIGAPSSGRQQPDSFIVRKTKIRQVGPDGVLDVEKHVEVKVGPMDFPLVFMAYRLPPPGILIGRNPDVDINYEVVCQISEEEFRRFAPGDKDGFLIAPMNPEAYVRMLAKIAHAYAVAELGQSSFRPSLREFIRGEPMAALKWIGGDTVSPKAEQRLHDIRWYVHFANDLNYLVVSLRLFAFVGSPQYHIVVGELTRPLDQLPFLQQPLYTIDVKTPLPLGDLFPLDERLRRTGSKEFKLGID
jgi:hypothetical protein